jgi:hypothetical protein
MSDDAEAIRAWWRTSIIDMEPGKIAFRGHPIEGLIGNVSSPQMTWLMTVGRGSRQVRSLHCLRRPWLTSLIPRAHASFIKITDLARNPQDESAFNLKLAD